MADTSGDWEYSVSSGEATLTGYAGVGPQVMIPGEIGGYPVVAMASTVFAAGNAITEVSIPGSVSRIDAGTFGTTSSLVRIVVDASNPAFSDQEGVLYDRAGATLVRYPPGRLEDYFAVPAGVTAIEAGAFQDCVRLTNIELPEGLVGIGADAFVGCDSLTSITLPDTVATIEDGVFNDCPSLVEVFFLGDKPSDGDPVWKNCPAEVYALDDFPVWAYSAGPVTRVATIPVSVSSDLSPVSLRVGADYTYRITGRGSPHSFSAKGLPSGLRLDAQSGLITGRPGKPGAYTVTLQVNRNGTIPGKATKRFTVVQSPVFSYAATLKAVRRGNVEVRPKVSGYPAPEFAVVAGSLPPGLKLHPRTAAITGKPTRPGAYTFTVRGANSAGILEKTATMVVKEDRQIKAW